MNQQMSAIPAYRTEQILRAEEVALARDGQVRLMQRAAMAVATAGVRVLQRVPGPLPGRRAVLLVGVGNNGGDALIAGALLQKRGIAVTAVLLDPERTHARGLSTLRRAGGRSLIAEDPAVPRLLDTADLIIDGIVGIGATPPLRANAAALVDSANTATGFRLAVDLPSGIDPNTGHAPGTVFHADLTVTLGAAKTGVLVAEASGQVEIAPIGLDLAERPDSHTYGHRPIDVPGPGTADNKFSTGVLGIAAGSEGYPGAAVLCVGAAVRARPGMVRYAGSQTAAVLARWPEVVAAPTVTGTGRVQAWVVGPGLGTDESALHTLRAVLAADVPVLVDADGLTLLAQHKHLLAQRAASGRQTVLTPHAGEFSRVFPEHDGADRLTNARNAARSSGATVLLKGSRTIVTDGSDFTAINMSGSGWLATAGSGDVLSGLIGSLLAGGRSSTEAAALGAHLHGLAGDRAKAAGDAGAQQLWFHLRR